MKELFTLFLLVGFAYSSLNAQVAANNNSDTLAKKQRGDTSYFFKYIPVTIENGHGDSIVVSFSGEIPVDVWQSMVTKSDNNEKVAFFKVARSLSLKAQYSLINKMSFEPLKKQFFFMENSQFVCVYEMMGRNGLGNSIETKAVVKYTPN